MSVIGATNANDGTSGSGGGARRVLVAYGSTNGSTAEIAGWVAQALREDGLQVELADADHVEDVSSYDGVVVGGAVYVTRWHPAAQRLTRRHAEALRGRPVWLFSSGPLDTSADRGPVPVMRGAGKAASRVGAVEHVTFGGRIAPDAPSWMARRMAGSGLRGDFRNPERVRAWAHGIGAQLRARHDETAPADH
ncbi:MAG TPA: flavodoxin domain-containing protein [Motilibacteraceae bacterium]|nr:flavodoxin domain-containing protein [Motilibacteraceae bacterium]